jgi:tetratricopeptide (TPR) repeat protein
MNFNKMKNLFVLLISIFSITAFAQDINQAGDLFNEGNQAVKNNNFQLAIDKYSKAMEVAEQVGPEGEMIVINAQSQIPQLYYKLGVTDFKEKKIDKAIDEFEKAIEFGKKYNDPGTVEKAKATIPKLYYSKGASAYKEDKYEEALANYQKAIDNNPDYSRAFYGMAITYNKLGDTPKMRDSFETALKLAEADNDDKMITQIKKNGKKLFLANGQKGLQAQDWDKALTCLNASLSFDDASPDTYYYIALANNGLKQYTKAVEAADKGLAMSTDQNDDYKAKFYYELGNAYKGQGQNSKACEAYKNAKHGSFSENANYEITQVLKCN